MFKSISWQEFLYAVALLAGGYYLVVVAVFYSRDILLRLKGATVAKVKPVQPPARESDSPMMGKILSDAPRKKLKIKQSIAESDELTFESQPEKDLQALKEDSPASAFLEDLDEVFMSLSATKKPKTEFIKSIRRLFRRNPEFQDTSTKQGIYNYIQDYFKNSELSFSAEELDTLWLDGKQEVIHQSTTKNNYEN